MKKSLFLALAGCTMAGQLMAETVDSTVAENEETLVVQETATKDLLPCVEEEAVACTEENVTVCIEEDVTVCDLVLKAGAAFNPTEMLSQSLNQVVERLQKRLGEAEAVAKMTPEVRQVANALLADAINLLGANQNATVMDFVNSLPPAFAQNNQSALAILLDLLMPALTQGVAAV